jgi:GWxTD domain-containing protein
LKARRPGPRVVLRAALGGALIAAVLSGATPSTPPVSKGQLRRAEAHYKKAMRLLERSNFDTRRLAIQELEQATLLAPENPSYELTLARTYYDAGFIKSARLRFERVVRMAPNDAGGRFGLGQVWRRDWLKYLDRGSLERAVQNFSLSSRMSPSNVDSWLMLVPLLVETNDLRSAHSAAIQARIAGPERAEALLAAAYTSYRMGHVESADSAFTAAFPRLSKSVRERLDDISPVATERDTFVLRRLKPHDQVEFVRRFWKELDPDLATRENEAQLEYWSRVAQAYFLFYNPKRREWDERGEVYVRYGPPRFAVYNPVTLPRLGTRNVLLWEYPDLGMRVVMEDRLLSEYYLLPITFDYDPDPAPDPNALSRLDDRLSSAGGRGVFPKLPPNVEPLPIEGAVACFQGARGTRLLAQVESPGAPDDSMWAEWVVLDSTRREIERGRRPLSPSACEATERRVADFMTELPPGEYMVGLSVRDTKGRRGVYRSAVRMFPTPTLALSDLVISCGPPSVGTTAGPPTVRLEPNPGARVKGDEDLTAYFEIYHLSQESDGQSRFEYVYTVSSAEKDPRIWIKRLFAPRSKPDPISVSREEMNPSDLRRQFVTVPIHSLPVGRYKFEVRVRDLVANAVVVGSTQFVKTAAN